MSTLIQSGYPGVASQSVTMSAQLQNFELQFPVDLKAVLDAFKTHLGLKIIYPEQVSAASNAAFCMIDWVGWDTLVDELASLVTFNITVERPRSSQDVSTGSADTLSIRHTLNRLRRLFYANPHFDNLAGIQKLESLTIITGENYVSAFETENISEGGLLNVVYRLADTRLRQ